MSTFTVTFVLADKGGVRKTFLAIHLFRYLQSKGVKLKAVDADLTYSPLARRLPADDVVLFDVQEGQYLPGNPNGVDRIAQLLEAKTNLLFDCGANTTAIIRFIFEDLISLRDEIKRLGGKAVFILPTDGEEKTDFQADETIKAFQDWATVLVAKCLPGHNSKDIKVNIPSMQPGMSFTVPGLEPGLLQFYRQNRVPLDVIAANPKQAFGIEMPFYARSYLRQLYAQFDTISHHLIR